WKALNARWRADNPQLLPVAGRMTEEGRRATCRVGGGADHPGRAVRRLRRSPGASLAEDTGPVGRRGGMRWELRRVADLTAGEQAAVRTLALAVYPPEVAAAWPGRAIEGAAHQWAGVGGAAEGAAP